jgi:hypothetical protein
MNMGQMNLMDLPAGGTMSATAPALSSPAAVPGEGNQAGGLFAGMLNAMTPQAGNGTAVTPADPGGSALTPPGHADGASSAAEAEAPPGLLAAALHGIMPLAAAVGQSTGIPVQAEPPAASGSAATAAVDGKAGPSEEHASKPEDAAVGDTIATAVTAQQAVQSGIVVAPVLVATLPAPALAPQEAETNPGVSSIDTETAHQGSTTMGQAGSVAVVPASPLVTQNADSGFGVAQAGGNPAGSGTVPQAAVNGRLPEAGVTPAPRNQQNAEGEVSNGSGGRTYEPLRAADVVSGGQIPLLSEADSGVEVPAVQNQPEQTGGVVPLAGEPAAGALQNAEPGAPGTVPAGHDAGMTAGAVAISQEAPQVRQVDVLPSGTVPGAVSVLPLEKADSRAEVRLPSGDAGEPPAGNAVTAAASVMQSAPSSKTVEGAAGGAMQQAAPVPQNQPQANTDAVDGGMAEVRPWPLEAPREPGTFAGMQPQQPVSTKVAGGAAESQPQQVITLPRSVSVDVALAETAPASAVSSSGAQSTVQDTVPVMPQGRTDMKSGSAQPFAEPAPQEEPAATLRADQASPGQRAFPATTLHDTGNGSSAVRAATPQTRSGNVVVETNQEHAADDIVKLAAHPAGKGSGSETDSGTSDQFMNNGQSQTPQLHPQAQAERAGTAAVPASSQPAASPSDSGQIAGQVRDRLVGHDVKPGSEQVTLKLSPEHLGDLKLNMNLEGQRLKVEIVAENRMVRDALLQHADSLKESLARQNITMESFDVTTGGRGSGNPSGQGQESQWRELARQQQQYARQTGGYRLPEFAMAASQPAYQQVREYGMVDVHF